MKKLWEIIKDNIYLLILTGLSLVLLAVNIRINIFSYQNFDFGKFDLGNMTQMVWNTLHGRLLYLTDYFGANVPRWAMSHVDPILLLFVPVFYLYPHPLTLVFSQLVLVLFSSLLIYKISELELGSKFLAFCLGLAYLFYPAVGFLTAKTGFHGVTAAVPFFLGAFYVFEKMYKTGHFSKKGTFLFWVLLVITMTGKEQIPLYVILYGFYVLIFRNYHFAGFRKIKIFPGDFRDFISIKPVQNGIAMVLVGLIWFFLAFFVIIPKYSVYRVEGYNRFTKSLDINQDTARDVAMPNYFLSRYGDFGDSYTDIIKNIILDHKTTIRTVFSGDKIDNFRMTFEPLLYLPFLFPALFYLAFPDLAINYLTSSDSGGISEIYNHRISMIVPVLFLSVIYFISAVARLTIQNKEQSGLLRKVPYFIAVSLVFSTLYTSSKYDNPVYLWIKQAVGRRMVFAKSDQSVLEKELKVGEQVKLSALESRDRECAEKLVSIIPEGVSVSGPDYLGSHLAQRETYAIFPALYNEADYVIVDVFSRKIFTILGLDSNMLKDIIKNMIEDPNYSYKMGCGNIFVYERKPNTFHETLLPIQERLRYKEKYNYEIQEGLNVVDFSYPDTAERGDTYQVSVTYSKVRGNKLNNYIMFLSFINKETGEMYQIANLPSFGIRSPIDWSSGRYYIEKNSVVIPDFVEPGATAVFLGASDSLKTKSIYLGEMEIK